MSINARHAIMDRPGSRHRSTDAVTAFHRSGSDSDDDRDTLLATAALSASGYTVIDLLGRSRVMHVFEVWSLERDCSCVAKMVRHSRQPSSCLLEQLLNEGRYLQSFAHPHLVRAYETLEEPTAIVILEALPGQTLDYIIRTIRRPMPTRSLALLGLHLCSAVHYLHRHDVLHLDLKPSNIVCSHGLAKVIDLSVAAPPGPVRAGCGTRGYLSPEQARGGVTTAAADVWGIGSTLCETATGSRPFEPEDRTERYPQLKGRAPLIRTRRPRLPRRLSTAIDTCLEPIPTDRPTVAELVTVLNSLVPDEVVPHTRSVEQYPL